MDFAANRASIALAALLHIGQYVGVRIQGKPNAAMAEKFTHNFGVDALLQK